jgi:hypothetical protein
MSRIRNFVSSFRQGCLNELTILIVLCILVYLILSLGQDSSQEDTPPYSPLLVPTAAAFSGTPSPPAETPLPTAGTPPPNCQPGIEVGKIANVVYHAVRMRHSSGHIEKNDATDTKHYLKGGNQVLVVGGPEIKDGLCWWLVTHQEQQGWTADHSQQGRLLLAAGP